MKNFFAFILISGFLHLQLHAQLCTGSLGDPADLTTFGDKANPPAQLPLDATSYEYSGGCPKRGQYLFGTLLFGCFDNSWHTLVADHTPGDQDGRYMLVNAGSMPGTIYKGTANGLCPNTTYEMSAWIVNVQKKNICTGVAIQPNIRFTIETLNGTVLGNYSTGNIAETDQLSWKQYGTFFKTPANTTSVIFKLINDAASVGDCGNVFAFDDISFRPCGPKVSAGIGAAGSSQVSICDGDNSSFILTGTYTQGFDNPVFQWQVSNSSLGPWTDISNATSISYLRTPTPLGIYYYRLAVAEAGNIASLSCRVYSEPVSIFFSPLPFVQITNYVYGCYGSPVVLFAAGGSRYEWTGPNGFSSNEEGPVIPEVQFTDAGNYQVRVTTDRGCSDTASVDLVVYPAAHATISPDVSVCEGNSITITAGGGISYQWTPNYLLSNDTVASPLATPKDTTKFTVRVTNQYGCNDFADVTVNVWKKPTADAGPDKRTRIGIPVTFDGFATGTDLGYYWTPDEFMDNDFSLKPTVDAPQSGTYTLHVFSNHGCPEATDNVFVKVYDKIYIPNAFSPNGDGINDTWLVEPLDLFYDAELQVYNRYGQIVYRNKGAYTTPWNGTRNGTALPVGTYYYILDLKIKNEKPMAGSVTIIR